jgi:transaldolase
MIKIPATEAGLRAFEDATADGVAVNVTLIFAARRHREVAEAYVRGLERLVARGGDPSRVPSVASLFVSRVDAAVDARLSAAGAPDELRGRAAIANARLAHAAATAAFAGDRWAALAAHGARPQRSLWASTGIKNPNHRDVRYVEELIGPGTVSTMPPATLAAFADHGVVRPTLDADLEAARYALAAVRTAGVDLEATLARLEADGVAAFAASHAAALDRLDERRAALQPTR